MSQTFLAIAARFYHKRSLGQEESASQTGTGAPYCDHGLLKRMYTFRNTTWVNSGVAAKKGSWPMWHLIEALGKRFKGSQHSSLAWQC